MSNPYTFSVGRLSGYAAASLWHRRLVRSRALSSVKVQPRLSAELTLHPVRRETGKPFPSDHPRTADSRHAA